MPSTHAKATRRSAKLRLLLIQRSAQLALPAMQGTVSMARSRPARSAGSFT
jgi:hypothetical protein